jgi:hypothetical protein
MGSTLDYSEAADFASADKAPKPIKPTPQDELTNKLKSIDPNDFTPKEALEFLFKLKAKK